MRAIHHYALAVTAAGGALLSGCATPIPGAPPVVVECVASEMAPRSGPALIGQPYGMLATPIPLDSVQFSSARASRAVAVQQLFGSLTETKTAQVTARFVSCSDAPIAIRVRVSFMERTLAPAEPTSAWQTVFLQPRTIGHFSEKSISTRVAHYLIEVTLEDEGVR